MVGTRHDVSEGIIVKIFVMGRQDAVWDVSSVMDHARRDHDACVTRDIKNCGIIKITNGR